MRDDLHHSFPQPHPWRKVVQAACNPGFGADLVDTLNRAIWAQSWCTESWGKQFLEVLSTPQGELFGTEQMETKLLALEDECPSSDARRALNIALAEISGGQSTKGLSDRVVLASHKASAEDRIEGVVAWVATKHPKNQVGQLRAVLLDALPKCNLQHPPAPKPRKQKLTIEQNLDTELPLKV